MSKERLEEAKQVSDDIKKFHDKFDHVQSDIAKCYFYEVYGRWLIEQVEQYHSAKDKHALIKANIALNERVWELERANKQLKGNLNVYKGYYNNTLKHNKELIEENKRHRESLWDINMKLRDLFIEVWDM